jgi:DNA (cytosine-5)-methyltransferase 1
MEDQALGEALIWDDLRSFDGRPWRGRVHLVAAGYPCQPFSTSGNRLGSADPRHLWPDIARIVEEISPEWIFCENVEGHLTLGYPEVAESLSQLGYTTKAGLFTAREAGAGHRRRRLFILAHADSERRGVFSGSDHPSRRDVAELADRHSGEQWRSDLAVANDAELDGGLAGDPGAGVDIIDGEIPLFAPGPAQLQEWERLLLERPDLQPALPRDDDGLADRVDRIRGVGNGVSSLVAAIAWAVLKAAHGVRS